ncbi:MAG: hypothetical protein A3J39_09820 [Sulfuricurvum sp. RIFCSPHIGHO2_12_FULL_44_8]|nr:MAG: hypothetical protein A3J39_09820 [Sulfuricurvum sp. RIFCSPHIGHO2_12_FULL_44_8]
MIDLCIDARMAFFSGIGTCIRELVPYLNQPPFKAVLLVDHLDQAWCKGIEQILLRCPIYSIREQVMFPIKIPKCDLFWSPHYNIPLLPIKAKRRVVTIHDACHLALGKNLSLFARLYANRVMRWASYRSDQVITDSRFSAKELCHYLGNPRTEIRVIPVATNLKRFQRKRDPVIRDKYQLPEKFALFVGNLKPHKNLHGLAKAFTAASLPGWGLVLVGMNKQNEKIENALILGKVPEEELPMLYSLAELLVFPSFYEGFGLPPLEAMSCGCPTVVSNAASIPEVCGEASLYFHPGRVEEMAAAIKRVALYQELRSRLVQKGFERVRQFDWGETARQYRSVFEEVCRL